MSGRGRHVRAIVVGLLLTVLELYRISRPDGPKGSAALLGACGIGLFALTVMGSQLCKQPTALHRP